MTCGYFSLGRNKLLVRNPLKMWQSSNLKNDNIKSELYSGQNYSFLATMQLKVFCLSICYLIMWRLRIQNYNFTGCHVWTWKLSLKLLGERRLRMIGNPSIKRISGPTRNEAGSSTKLHQIIFGECELVSSALEYRLLICSCKHGNKFFGFHKGQGTSWLIQ